ncbi:MAG: DUF3500 domain-containing protein [Planctomycetaceae bacterium]|nr:DUF3500 domain-containing protein [Planctomycetaceae bacterium]
MSQTMRLAVLPVLLTAIVTTTAVSYFRTAPAATDINAAAKQLVEGLDERQKTLAVLPYASSQRVDWHFIPMDTRKGLMLRHMSEAQQEQALQLMQSVLSAAGYKKARTIMSLEKLLYSLEDPKTRDRRDELKYYFTMFGEPGGEKSWGLSIEGHHLSLNFVVENNQLIAATPQFFASNPATIKTENSLGFELNSAVLQKEEQLGFDLVNSLTADQKKVALIDAKAPKEIRNAGSVHPPTDKATGIPAGQLTKTQQEVLRDLIGEYAHAVKQERAAFRLKEIEDAGFANITFSWAGATEPGIGHYYRIQGKSFLIEFVNTQPDAAGNPANHIHCVWRDMDGDFALPIQ